MCVTQSIPKKQGQRFRAVGSWREEGQPGTGQLCRNSEGNSQVQEQEGGEGRGRSPGTASGPVWERPHESRSYGGKHSPTEMRSVFSPFAKPARETDVSQDPSSDTVKLIAWIMEVRLRGWEFKCTAEKVMACYIQSWKTNCLNKLAPHCLASLFRLHVFSSEV